MKRTYPCVGRSCRSLPAAPELYAADAVLKAPRRHWVHRSRERLKRFTSGLHGNTNDNTRTLRAGVTGEVSSPHDPAEERRGRVREPLGFLCTLVEDGGHSQQAQTTNPVFYTIFTFSLQISAVMYTKHRIIRSQRPIGHSISHAAAGRPCMLNAEEV